MALVVAYSGIALLVLGGVMMVASYLFCSQRHGIYFRFLSYDYLSPFGRRLWIAGYLCLLLGTIGAAIAGPFINLFS